MKRLMRRSLIAVSVILLTALGLFGFRIPDFLCRASDHERVFDQEELLSKSAEDLASTVITSHLEYPIKDGKNVLWCGSFQLAWNEACTLVGEDLNFVKNHPDVAILNKKTFKKTMLDDASYVAIAGFVRDGIFEKISGALDKKFKGQAKPKLIPDATFLRPQDFVAYSYMFKNLEFGKTFELPDEPITFQKTKVQCFGIARSAAPDAAAAKQVVILDHHGPDDFIIELKTKAEGDRVILAKMKPEADLQKTIAKVAERIKKPAPAVMVRGDILKIPKLNFDLTREYKEYYGLLDVKSPEVAKDIGLISAKQGIRFQMNEKGVKLRSESHTAFGCSAVPPPPAVLVFDKPFLILMQRNDAEAPYFALWVDNAELLLKDGR